MFLQLFIGVVTLTGLSEGQGLLPHGPLNASVGGIVVFRPTLNSTVDPMSSVSWYFGVNSPIIFSQPENQIIAPEYKGRITFFRSTGSLELRNLKSSDAGEYNIVIVLTDSDHQKGSTRLDIYMPVSSVTVTPPSSDLVEFNNPVSLFCSASGPSLSFLWMNGSSEITASDRVQINIYEKNSSLTIINVTRYDQGPYTCHVSNLVSNANSDPVTLLISYGPENIQLNVSPPKDHHKEGSDISLICSVESQPPPKFKWFLNGEELLDTGVELVLKNAKESQSGNYSCQAFNDKTLRSTTSQPSVVSVLTLVSNVKVILENADLVEFNSSVRLSCSSSGSSLSFLWMNSSSEVTTSDRIQITGEGSTLTIISVTRYDQGPYSCNVSNPLSHTSSDQKNLSISYGPENLQLNISPSKEHYEEGSDVILRCSAESKPTAEYLWLLNGGLLPDERPELRLMNIQMNQRGNYSCQAFNSKTLRYETSQSSAVSVRARISNVVVDSNSTDLVEFNSSVTLSCSSSGFSPFFYWMNGSSEVTDGDRFQLSNGNSTLKMFNVTRSDQGLLRCQASNYFSKDSSDPVNLNINYGPEDIVLTITPNKEHYEEGTDVVLSCSANSKPDATFLWFLNENPVVNPGSQFKLINIRKNQTGNYSCQAFNEKTLRYLKSQILTVSVSGSNSSSAGLSAGAIAAIVVVCLVFIAGLSVGLFIKTSKKSKKISPRRIISTITGGNKKNNTDNTSEELNYAELKFQKKKKGQTDQVDLENTSEYTQIRVNNRPAASSPYAPEQNYAEINKRNGGAVHLEFDISSPDTHIKVNANGPPAPPPKTYKGQNEQLRGPAPHDAKAEQLYSQVHKSQRR